MQITNVKFDKDKTSHAETGLSTQLQVSSLAVQHSGFCIAQGCALLQFHTSASYIIHKNRRFGNKRNVMVGGAGHDRGPHGPSRFAQAPRRFPAASLQSPEQPDTLSGAQFTPPSRGPNNEDGEVQSSSRRQATSAEPALSAGGTSERRATVDRECARLEQEGAPEGTRWGLAALPLPSAQSGGPANSNMHQTYWRLHGMAITIPSEGQKGLQRWFV